MGTRNRIRQIEVNLTWYTGPPIKESFVLEPSQIFEMQTDFARRIDWNRYEKCETPGTILDFFKHLILVMVDELGEISRVRKKFLGDQSIQTMRQDEVKFLERPHLIMTKHN